MTLSNITICHLAQSSNVIKMDGKLIVFDYPSGSGMEKMKVTDGLDTGYVNPNQIKDELVYVFVSHGHKDHFTPAIFQWRKIIKNIKFIISHDIKDHPDEVIVVKADETIIVYDIKNKGLFFFRQLLVHLHTVFLGIPVFFISLNWFTTIQAPGFRLLTIGADSF